MKALNDLAGAIASTLANEVKAQHLPAVAVQFGMADGEGGEAFGGKAAYVSKRLVGWPRDRLIAVARQVVETFRDDSLQVTLEAFDPEQPFRLSDIIRQQLFKYLDSLPAVQGNLGITEFMSRLWSLQMPFSGTHYGTLFDFVDRHMVRNDDCSFTQTLDSLNLKSMSNQKLVELLELAVHPLVRTDSEQAEVVSQLNFVLRNEGLALVASDQVSGYPVYKVVENASGVRGTAKNVIFASIGPKPEIVISDAINNDLSLVKNEDSCLVYDRPTTTNGILWRDLIEWWAERESLEICKETEAGLFKRLRASLASEPERLLFHSYFKFFRSTYGDRLPALIPQVYLHYDPYTRRQLGKDQRVPRQRMDFLLLLSPMERIVLEVDGQQHYSDHGTASPRKYAEMAAADRSLRLAGYEVYRFGGAELSGMAGEEIVEGFFSSLFQKHGVRPPFRTLEPETTAD